MMNRREILRAGGAFAALWLLGCNQAPKPVAPSRTSSTEKNLDQIKAYIEERKNILIPGFYKWLQEVQPNMPLTLDETMKAFILVGSFKEWESTVGSDPDLTWTSVGIIEPKVHVNVEKFDEPSAVPNRRVDASLIQAAAIFLTRKVDQPNLNLIVDRNGAKVKATDVFVKGFTMYGYVGPDKVSDYHRLDEAAATILVFQYLQDNSKSTIILYDSDLPARHLLWAAKLNNDLKARSIDPKLFRYWHIESDLGRLAGAFGGASTLASPSQEAVQKGLDYLKREHGD